jgi:hypothetical protein
MLLNYLLSVRCGFFRDGEYLPQQKVNAVLLGNALSPEVIFDLFRSVEVVVEVESNDSSISYNAPRWAPIYMGKTGS